jgi:tRNA(Ile)-lysidine synthase
VAVLDPAVAAVRNATRRSLADLPAGATVLVACSGGPDSLALADAALFESRHTGVHCGLVTVDHGLQDGSAMRAERVIAWGSSAGFHPVVSVAVDVSGRPGGPEAAARDARYEALAATAHQYGVPTVLLGHTRDDQAETVLLALARGAGPRGLAGMPERRIRDGVAFVRPLLDVARADTRKACVARGLAPWDDPHNEDPAYARARLRSALPVLVEVLGRDVVTNLARTARLLAADTEALDDLAAAVLGSAVEADGALEIRALDGVPDAIRTRVLHMWAKRLGVPGSALSHRHVDALDALVVRWHGQGPTALPGGLRIERKNARLVPVQENA